MRVLRALAVVVGLLVLVVGLGSLALRWHDGPVGPFAGGAFRSGEPVPVAPVDWSFARDVEEIELQLVEPARSRTVWVLVHEKALYVPCGFLDVPLWKQWPHQALADGRALLRIEGRIYPGRAVRVDDPDLWQTLLELAAAKYGFDPGGSSPETTWFFRVEPRGPTP